MPVPMPRTTMDDEYEAKRLREERREQALCNAFHQDDEDEGEDENADEDEDEDGLKSTRLLRRSHAEC